MQKHLERLDKLSLRHGARGGGRTVVEAAAAPLRADRRKEARAVVLRVATRGKAIFVCPSMVLVSGFPYRINRGRETDVTARDYLRVRRAHVHELLLHHCHSGGRDWTGRLWLRLWLRL